MAELDDSALAKDDSLESAMTNIVLSDFARYAFLLGRLLQRFLAS